MLGRPKKEDSREKQYRIRLNDKEDKMLTFASDATGIPKSEIFRKALQEYCEKVKLQQASEEIGDDTTWEYDRISLQRAIECPYCKVKNRIDLENEGIISTSERQMGNEVLYEFENVEHQCHSCGRAFTVSGYITEYPLGAFNAESLKVAKTLSELSRKAQSQMDGTAKGWSKDCWYHRSGGGSCVLGYKRNQ